MTITLFPSAVARTPTRHRKFLPLLWMAALLCCSIADAKPVSFSMLTPSALFVQAGFAENNTDSYVLGVTWDWQWVKQFSFGTLSGYSEASFGRWTTEVGETRGSTWATQLGLTPVLRLRPAFASRQWFAEIGIGANVILPIYRSKDKSFSTEFNFGDHIAVGRSFGSKHRQELALRLQHFSNAGIDHPNPGENFFQLRYAYRF